MPERFAIVAVVDSQRGPATMTAAHVKAHGLPQAFHVAMKLHRVRMDSNCLLFAEFGRPRSFYMGAIASM